MPSKSIFFIGKEKKMVQFFVYFHMMAKGRPMIDYNNVNKLFDFVEVKNFPKFFLSNVVGWEMVFCMHNMSWMRMPGSSYLTFSLVLIHS